MSTSPRKYRGSRKHILDWTSQPAFVVQLLQLIEPVSCKITAASEWMPKGYLALEEARLERFGPKTLPGHPAWDLIRGWWLKHSRGANTPNWDLAVRAEIDEKPGLILVEAKANVPELSASGKFLPKEGSSSNSFENHDHIGRAIDDVNSDASLCSWYLHWPGQALSALESACLRVEACKSRYPNRACVFGLRR